MSDIPHYFLYGECLPSEALQHVHIASLEESLPKHQWEIHPHRHDNLHQLLIVRQGNVLTQVEERKRKEHGPCLLSIPPTKVHGFVHQPDVKGLIVTITQSFLRHLFDDTERKTLSHLFLQPLVARPEPGSEIAGNIDYLTPQLLAEYKTSQSQQASMLGAYLKILLLLLHRTLKTVPATNEQRGNKTQYFEQFLVLVEEYYAEHRTVAQYAHAMNMTTGRLNALCQHHSGQSALQIIHERVLTEAKRHLIYTQLSAKEIAYKLGFKDTGYFSRFFSRKCGTTPGKFRRTFSLENPAFGL